MASGQYIAICVSDSGTGMPPDVIARAFDPFFTTKPAGQGTGLGLSMVYGFAKQSGGQARIYSEIGKGTTIRIYLPRHFGRSEEEEKSCEKDEMKRPSGGLTILVVDDDPTIRMLINETLADLGLEAIEAADASSGLKVLRSDVHIDLLITDVGLPGGMNGRQMADAAREARASLPVLFITGYAENAAVGNGHLDPGMHILTKPFAMKTLAARITAILTARS
jgi:CheY-like chemotaxis protein